MKSLRILTHPAVLIFLTVLSAILWMPFGIGYYDWPWQNRSMRFFIHFFVFGFMILAAISCIRAFRPKFLIVQFIISSLSLFVSLFGVFAMYWWVNK
jgi:hypothetical protein